MSDEPLPTQINLNQSEIAALAREMAIAIKDPDLVLETFRITRDQFEAYVLKNTFYKRAFEAFVIEWESALSTKKRIELQSAAAIEDVLPKLSARMSSGTEGLGAVTETAKLLAKLAGIGEDKKTPTEGERFSITINLGADTKLQFEETIGGAPLIDLQAAELPAPNQIPENTKG